MLEIGSCLYPYFSFHVHSSGSIVSLICTFLSISIFIVDQFIGILVKKDMFFYSFFLAGSHDQSPRLMERYSGDSDSFDPETMMTQLRHDLADAMMDTQHPGPCGDNGKCSNNDKKIYHCIKGCNVLKHVGMVK